MGGASKFLMLLSTPIPLLYPRPTTLRLARHSRLALTPLRTNAALSPRQRHPSSPSPFSRLHTRAAVREDGSGGNAVESPLMEGGGGGGGRAGAGAGGSHRRWPEWMRLVDHVTAGGYFDKRVSMGVDGGDDSFSEFERLPEEFRREAAACLAFARERPELLRSLSKKDIEVVVENGSPFLFENTLNSSRRMRAFLTGKDNSVENEEIAETVDVMRYLLGYVYNHLIPSVENCSSTMDFVEASVRNLFCELVGSIGTQVLDITEPTYRSEPLSFKQSTMHRRNIEMKRGDWICPKCQFMNFARNMKCLECNEVRPKRQLTGGEWECPQCDFFNYGRNMTCLRCDCKRPEGIQSSTSSAATGFGFTRNNTYGDVYNGDTNKNEIEHRLAENGKKAQRWFSKVSQMGDASDLSNAIADEDFPEIIPLRKGANRFVVSTRKTPLERRLANNQVKSNTVHDSSTEGTGSTAESTISSTLDRILSQSATQGKYDGANLSDARHRKIATESTSQRRDPGSAPFVPLPTDMFKQSEGQQPPENVISTDFQDSSCNDTVSSSASVNNHSDPLITGMPVDHSGSQREKMASTDTDDFPDIMPIRKGENRFVVSKKKDRSLTSPQYKRRLAMEQANGSNFVPFVPFPPGYFAKKNPQPESGDSTTKTESAITTSPPEVDQSIPENPSNTERNCLKSESLNVNSGRESERYTGDSSSNSLGGNWNTNDVGHNDGRGANSPSSTDNSWTNTEAQRNRFIEQDGSGRWNEARISNSSSWNNDISWNEAASVNPPGETPPLSLTNKNESWRNGSDKADSTTTYTNDRFVQPSLNNDRDGRGSHAFSGSNSDVISSVEKPTQQMGTSQNARQGWNGGLAGKSLEGSAVTEPDPLDMSEEAKAQRWFRRVAQITDISELSKIPDEDFPSIMPMRKGVNRFVVSKRKTPLERRLTSPRYRRNLPIVSSEPRKDSKQEDA